MPAETNLLIADGDLTVRNIIRIAAQDEGWCCDEAAEGIRALKLFRRNPYHLAVLDCDLPELDGKIVCRQIRKLSAIPVIFLGLRTEEAQRLACFSAGGNDYILKPFYPRELVARIRSLLTLFGHECHTRKVISCGKIQIDLFSRSVQVESHTPSLTPKEYDLLLFLCQNPSKVYSRDALLNLVWGEDFYGSDRTVDTHIKSLRSKLRPYHHCIVTVWGVGYKLEER